MGAEFDTLTFRVLFALFELVILSILVERGLYFIFDYRHLRERLKSKGIKAPIAFGVSWFVCWHHDFDIIALTIDPEATTQIGIFITASIVAGGSAAAMTLFNDVLKFTRSAREEIKRSEAGLTTQHSGSHWFTNNEDIEVNDLHVIFHNSGIRVLTLGAFDESKAYDQGEGAAKESVVEFKKIKGKIKIGEETKISFQSVETADFEVVEWWWTDSGTEIEPRHKGKPK